MPQLPGKYCLSPVLAAHHTVLMFTKKWSVPLAAAILDSEKAPGSLSRCLLSNSSVSLRNTVRCLSSSRETSVAE